MDLCWHEDPVYESDGPGHGCCKGCNERFKRSDPLYECFTCDGEWHSSCVPSSPEDLYHPCHPSHPLKILLQGPSSYDDGKCNLCQRKLSTFLYHCKLCDFSLDMGCAKNPPPFVVDHPKCHEHSLTLMARDVSFTCNACGTHGERNPYVCLPCALMFHYDCIDLPHVININRHEHRISYASPIRPGFHVCEICRQDINWRYGAYSCSECQVFFVHSSCATRKDVWDGVELEGTDEEEVDTTPFEEIEEGVINHFSHEEHNLILIEDVLIDGGGEGIHCEACSHSISFERYYKCMMECDFMLHEECANLPLQKRHALSTHILSISTSKDNDNLLFNCAACGRLGTGFRYYDGEDIVLDVHCASLFWFRHRKLHPHTLFLTTLDRGTCVGCDKTKTYVLGCIECEYSLDFQCATLPVVIKHKCDDHYLFLRCGEEKKDSTGRYWCEICEAETNPEKWFFSCYDCGVVCHIDCVIGDSLNIKPGVSYMNEMKIETVVNDHNSRPLCSSCGSRCKYPMVYKYSRENIEGYYCSLYCTWERNE
ncbi:unnamed protein product [Thlaspi arvense]|uniref:Phorbol-ester/DAG-type domain-containing protein n=1 Tax=Thlaspi arvense TaxID=13288 RepID=A0AAU9S8N4_THLAR|nr:unnamed protein product [Thlaspi arvense]